MSSSPNRGSKIAPGSMLAERYRLGAMLGIGGWAEVYLATDERLQREVAVKILRREQLRGSTIKRFEREAQRMAAVDSSHVVPVYDVGQDGPFIFLVMKLLNGETLEEVLRRRGHLSPATAVYIIGQVLEGLEHLHRSDIVHRDIKPSNIMVVAHRQAMILDLGIARSPVPEHSSTLDDLRRTTEEISTVGTPAYMAPERIANGPTDARSDLYSVGVTLFEVLTGKLPFDAASSMEMCVLHLKQPPPPPRDLNPDIPAELAAVVTRALEKVPEKRYASAEAMKSAMYAAVPGLAADGDGNSSTESGFRSAEVGLNQRSLELAEQATSELAGESQEGRGASAAAPITTRSMECPTGGGALFPAEPEKPVLQEARLSFSTLAPVEVEGPVVPDCPAEDTGSSQHSETVEPLVPEVRFQPPVRRRRRVTAGEIAATIVAIGAFLMYRSGGMRVSEEQLPAHAQLEVATQAAEPGKPNALEFAPASLRPELEDPDSAAPSATPVSSSAMPHSLIAGEPHGSPTPSPASATRDAEGHHDSGLADAGKHASKGARGTPHGSSATAGVSPSGTTGSKGNASALVYPTPSGPDDELAVALRQLEHADASGALRTLDKATAKTPRRADLYWLRGHCFVKLGNRTSAIAAYRRYLALSSDPAGISAVSAQLTALGGL